MTEPYPALRRVERDGTIACGVMAAAAWALARGHIDAPLGVLGGGALVWISYRGIKGGVDALTGASGSRRVQTAMSLECHPLSRISFCMCGEKILLLVRAAPATR